MKRKSVMMLLGLLTWLLAACNTDVELCLENEHPHYATVEYRYYWGNIQEHDDSMLVVATRVINQWKSAVRVSATGDPSRGIYLWNAPNGFQLIDDTPIDTDEGEEGEEGEETTEGDETTEGNEGGEGGEDSTPAATRAGESETPGITQFKLRSGDYKFITFNRSDDEIDYESVDRYLQNDNIPLSDLNVVYRSYAKNDPALRLLLPDWTDYNGYSDYMQPSLRPIYYDTLSVVQLRSNGLYRRDFRHLTRLTQHITLKFDISKNFSTSDPSRRQPFTIDSVYVEMSGIPYTINLATGYIDITTTKKMMFQADFDPDSDSNRQIHCSAVMDVPSIVKNKNEGEYVGPGIMQVIICCSAPDPDDPSMRRSKKFQGIINLYNTLQRADLIRLTDDGQHALRNVEEAVLVIDATMEVDGEKVVENTDDNGGLDVWKSVGRPIVVDI